MFPRFCDARRRRRKSGLVSFGRGASFCAPFFLVPRNLKSVRLSLRKGGRYTTLLVASFRTSVSNLALSPEPYFRTVPRPE